MYETFGSYDFVIRLLIAAPLILSIVLSSYLYIRYSHSIQPASYVNFALPVFTILIIFQAIMPMIRLLAGDIDTQVRMNLPMNSLDLILPSAVYGVLLLLFFYSFIYSLNYASNSESWSPSFIREDIDLFSLKIIYLISLLVLAGLFAVLNSIYPIEDIIKNPREFYKSSRVGFGHVYFLTSLMLKFVFLLSLYLFKSLFARILIFISISILISFLGSKSQILSIFFIYVLYVFFIEKKYFSLRVTLILVGSIGTSLLLFFLILQKSDFSTLVKILNYFDYFENFLTLFSQLNSYYLGILTIESNVYSVMPRIIFPDKPLYFGSFHLGQEIFPKQTYLNQGAPSFSFFGRGYADFGILSFLYFSLSGAISGLIIGILSNYRTIYSFIIILAVAYNPLLTFGSDGFVVEIFNIILSFVLFLGVNIIQILSSKNVKYRS